MTGKELESSVKIRMLVNEWRLPRSTMRWSRPEGMRSWISCISERRPEDCRRVLMTSWSEHDAEMIRFPCVRQGPTMAREAGSSSDTTVSEGEGERAEGGEGDMSGMKVG